MDEEPKLPRRGYCTVTSDPAKDILIGEAINFESIRHSLAFDGPAFRFSTIQNWEYFGGSVLAVTFKTAHSISTEGTAVMVAPGIALTAAHTMRDHLESLAAGHTACALFGFRDQGAMFWKLLNVTLMDDNDIAILCLEAASKLPEDRTYRHTCLSTRTPRRGEVVTTLGFRFERSGTLDEPMTAEFVGKAFVAKGEVTAVYSTVRDQSLLRWPSFEISANAVGAMSGGPVFDNNGFVIGLISSSLESDMNDGPTFATLLWPCLTIQISPEWPTGFFKGPVTLLGLDPRLCAIEGRTAITELAGHGEAPSSIRYREWDS